MLTVEQMFVCICMPTKSILSFNKFDNLLKPIYMKDASKSTFRSVDIIEKIKPDREVWLDHGWEWIQLRKSNRIESLGWGFYAHSVLPVSKVRGLKSSGSVGLGWGI